MFIVNDSAMGIARGGVQTTYGTEYTVTARPKEVACYVDWYHVAANKQNWGLFGIKVGLAYAAYIEGKVVKAMASSITSTGAAAQGIAGYIANGFSDSNFVTIARAVAAANGNAAVYALGTKIALMNIMPATTNSQFRYFEDGAIIKTGFLPEYKGVPLIELGNILVPNTINGTPQFMAPDNVIYMIPAGMYKPVKVVFEGTNLTVEKDPLQMADHTYTLTVKSMIGVDVIVGSKYGAITL